MGDHTLLTARDVHGPYVQLLTNLQGENGKEWLYALNLFLRKENPWFNENRFFKDPSRLHLHLSLFGCVDFETRVTRCLGLETLDWKILSHNHTCEEVFGRQGSELHNRNIKRAVALEWVAKQLEIQDSGKRSDLLVSNEKNVFPVLGRGNKLVACFVWWNEGRGLWEMNGACWDDALILREGSKVFEIIKY